MIDLPRDFRVVSNPWGWTLGGVATWLRYGWSWLDVWGVEVSGSRPRRFHRRVKLGVLCFELGSFGEAKGDVGGSS